MASVLGINAFHGDSSACLIKDGRLVAAAEEERFRRIKHWAGFPSEAIRYCLDEAGVSLTEVEHIAVNRDPRASLWRKGLYTLAQRPNPRFLWDRLKNAKKWLSIEQGLRHAFPEHPWKGTIHHVEHHLAHLASCFLVSPYQQALAVSIDGFGDFASAAWGIGQESTVTVKGKVFFPHSLGIFYQAVTQYLGFPHYGDEYKVMGLAAYGTPHFINEMRQIIAPYQDGTYRMNLECFRHHKEGVGYTWEHGAPTIDRLFANPFEELLGPERREHEPLTQRHKDIACSAQAWYEEIFFQLLNGLHAQFGLDTLCLAGGCAMNSVANGKLHLRTPFKRLYIQPAAGDAGGALGAAMVVWLKLGQAHRRIHMEHAYWGYDNSEQDFLRALETRKGDLAAQGCVVEKIGDEDLLCHRTAEALSEGQIVGWVQGRMEWGPRALGNRSILGDPRRADMRDILNLKIKLRESFRPFAPSVLREVVGEWFETEDDVPFMMRVFQVKKERQEVIPAVTHVDGSGRLQTVHRETNPRFYHLIEHFRDLTGVPMVLNTSFNENEPIVCYAEEALDCFLRTHMDVLVLGQHLIVRGKNHR